jgi:hypothetical protein
VDPGLIVSLSSEGGSGSRRQNEYGFKRIRNQALIEYRSKGIRIPVPVECGSNADPDPKHLPGHGFNF